MKIQNNNVKNFKEGSRNDRVMKKLCWRGVKKGRLEVKMEGGGGVKIRIEKGAEA